MYSWLCSLVVVDGVVECAVFSKSSLYEIERRNEVLLIEVVVVVRLPESMACYWQFAVH